MTNDDEGEGRGGGVTIPLKIDDVIYEQPLTRVSDMMVGAVNLKQTPSFPSATQHVLTEVTSMEC